MDEFVDYESLDEYRSTRIVPEVLPPNKQPPDLTDGFSFLTANDCARCAPRGHVHNFDCDDSLSGIETLKSLFDDVSFTADEDTSIVEDEIEIERRTELFELRVRFALCSKMNLITS